MMTNLPASSAPRWRQTLRTIMALKPVVALFWTLFGGTVMLMSGRLFLVESLKAETVSRIRADSTLAAHDSLMTVVVDSLRANGRVSNRAICLDHTQAEQAIIEVTCPRHLYRGAK